MNLNVLKRNSLVLLIFLICAGCSAYPSHIENSILSPIDMKYQLSVLRKENVLTPANATSIAIYQNVLSESLSSGCHHYPTDSGYAKIIFKKCGVITAILKTTSRFLLEPDGSKVYQSQVIEKNKLYFADIPNCIL